MFECENCSISHDASYGSGRFCSAKCSRSFSTRSKRKEINEKVSKSLSGRECPKDFECDGCGKKFGSKMALIGHKSNCDKNDAKLERERYNQNRLEVKLNASFEELSIILKREKIFREQSGKCNHCGLENWLGQKITLELEHRDGNTNNNDRSNLELLCPNCHSLTHTWRGRNKSKSNSRKRVSDEDLSEALKSSLSIRQALIKVGLAPKGANYFRAKKLKENLTGL